MYFNHLMKPGMCCTYNNLGFNEQNLNGVGCYIPLKTTYIWYHNYVYLHIVSTCQKENQEDEWDYRSRFLDVQYHGSKELSYSLEAISIRLTITYSQVDTPGQIKTHWQFFYRVNVCIRTLAHHVHKRRIVRLVNNFVPAFCCAILLYIASEKCQTNMKSFKLTIQHCPLTRSLIKSILSTQEKI